MALSTSYSDRARECNAYTNYNYIYRVFNSIINNHSKQQQQPPFNGECKLASYHQFFPLLLKRTFVDKLHMVFYEPMLFLSPHQQCQNT